MVRVGGWRLVGLMMLHSFCACVFHSGLGWLGRRVDGVDGGVYVVIIMDWMTVVNNVQRAHGTTRESNRARTNAV